MKQSVFIGVDDTDILGGPFGTGRVAKEMARNAESLGFGHTVSVIRLQLLVDPRIRYTSHNSAKCIEFEADVTLPELHQSCIKYLQEHFQEGSDPGICTCGVEQVTPELIKYAKSAETEVLFKDQAISLAKKSGILLTEIGGTGDGIIGALAAVGLMGGGNDGRYNLLHGIKEIKGLVTVNSLLNRTGIRAVIDENGNPVGGEETIDTQDWVKPNLINGQPTLRIRLRNGNDSTRTWESIEQRHKKEPKEAKKE
jgi:hypothetical protein